MSTSEFKVVSWSSPKTGAASAYGKSLNDVDPGVVLVDRPHDGVSEDAKVVSDDDGILEIVELICHNVATGNCLGQRQDLDPDRAIMRDLFADEKGHGCDLRSDRNLDQIIKLIDDS